MFLLTQIQPISIERRKSEKKRNRKASNPLRFLSSPPQFKDKNKTMSTLLIASLSSPFNPVKAFPLAPLSLLLRTGGEVPLWWDTPGL